MYRLLNYFFGWDYIAWRNSADSGIARIQVDGRGVLFYWRYKITHVADAIKDPKDVLWLTCPPEKYFPIAQIYQEAVEP